MFTRFNEWVTRTPDALAVAEPGGVCSYGELQAHVLRWLDAWSAAGVAPGAVVSIEGDYGVATVAASLAAIERKLILVPLSRDSQAHRDDFLELAQVEWCARPERGTDVERTGRTAAYGLFDQVRQAQAPGLVLFTSGSTGKNKAAVHDLSRLLRKFETPRPAYRTLVFLQLDHIGGVNTLLYTLSNGGAVVVPGDRSPATVAATIETHRVELLPTSPTFLNLLLLSGESERRDLSSLTLITYGTEPMPESTLGRVAQAFPHARLHQTYGLTEVGILRSKSRDSGSLWVRVGGEGYETKIRDGRLWVRAEAAMLGYLNAPSPFDAEGFLDTGDRVEVEGDWLRILGRDTDIINVGGSKVYPAEIESVLLQLEHVTDVVVFGEPHPMTGQVVGATFILSQPEPLADFKVRVRAFCRDKLPSYKIPVKIRLSGGPLHTERFKRLRRASASLQLEA